MRGLLDGVTRVITFADIAAGSPHLTAWWARLERTLPAVASRAAAVRVLPEHAGHCCNCKYCEEAVSPKLDEQEDTSDRPIVGRLYWNLSAAVSGRAFATALVTGIGVVGCGKPEARDEMARAPVGR